MTLEERLCFEIQDKLTEFNKIVKAVHMRVCFNDKGEAELLWMTAEDEAAWLAASERGGLSRSRDCEQKTSTGTDVV